MPEYTYYLLGDKAIRMQTCADDVGFIELIEYFDPSKGRLVLDYSLIKRINSCWDIERVTEMGSLLSGRTSCPMAKTAYTKGSNHFSLKPYRLSNWGCET